MQAARQTHGKLLAGLGAGLAMTAAVAACKPTPSADKTDTRFAGVERDALISVTGTPDLALIVYRADRIQPEQLAAMPSQLCADSGMAVTRVKDRKPFAPDSYPANTRLLYVSCA